MSLMKMKTKPITLGATIFIIAMLLVILMVPQAPTAENPPKISKNLAGYLSNSPESIISVLIETESNDYIQILRIIEEEGGTVTHQFKFANGLSANLPTSSVLELSRLPSILKVSLDSIRTPASSELDSILADPSAMTELGLTRKNSAMLDGLISDESSMEIQSSEFSVEAISNTDVTSYLSQTNPEQYLGPVTMNALDVWETNNLGQDSLVVIIDTGIEANHFMLSGSVVGGIDLSTDVGTVYEGPFEVTNHFHGTHVAGTVAGHGLVTFDPESVLSKSLELRVGYEAGSQIPLFGMAPLADLYAVKVFPHTGAGAPESTIIAGIEHAIDLKVNQGIDVDVISMSLGGGTGFDGRDLEDQTVDFASSVGITVVAAAGNDGPASLTVGSPGSANTAITVGAAAHPVNQRVFWDYNYGILGIGDLLYVSNDIQMVYFSSRGPTADGRDKPTLSATGAFVLSSFSNNGIGFSSGTSMATPAVSGAVALLNTVGESMGANPSDYKSALVESAIPIPYYDELETGAGYLDAGGAVTELLAKLDDNTDDRDISNGFSHGVATPIGENIQNVDSSVGATFDIINLFPGHVKHYYFNLHPNAEKITLDFSNVDLGIDPILFNSFEVHISSGVRTSDCCYYFATTNVWGDASFDISDFSSTVSGSVFGVNSNNQPLTPGYIRISIENDWTSYDSLSGTVNINVATGNNAVKSDETYTGVLNTGDSVGFFPVGYGTNGVELRLSWKNDWSRYPTSDLDLVIAWFDSDGNLNWDYSGATFISPELVRIESSDIVAVFVLVDGYQTYGYDEPFNLEVTYL